MYTPLANNTHDLVSPEILPTKRNTSMKTLPESFSSKLQRFTAPYVKTGYDAQQIQLELLKQGYILSEDDINVAISINLGESQD